MSWELWGKKISDDCGVPAGGIYDLDGNPWTEFGMTDAYRLGVEDFKAIQECISQKSPAAKPVKVGGNKHIVMMVDDGVLCAKNSNRSCLIAIVCSKCIVIGVGGEGSEPKLFLNKIEAIANSLKSSGY